MTPKDDTMPTETIVSCVLGVVVMVQTWILKEIVSLGRWRASSDARLLGSERRADAAYDSAKIAIASSERTSTELSRIKHEMHELGGELKALLERLDKRLDGINMRCKFHLESEGDE